MRFGGGMMIGDNYLIDSMPTTRFPTHIIYSYLSMLVGESLSMHKDFCIIVSNFSIRENLRFGFL